MTCAYLGYHSSCRPRIDEWYYGVCVVLSTRPTRAARCRVRRARCRRRCRHACFWERVLVVERFF